MTKQQFHFDNRVGSLTPLTQQVVGYLSGHIGQHVAAPALLFKAKFIVTELLTNALKHSAVSSVKLDVIITDSYVQIIKTDTGQPLSFFTDNSLVPGAKTALSQDAMHQLYACMGNNGEIYFQCEEEIMDMPDVNQINEHFGLLIITKTADEFTYWYDAPVNVFSAKVNL